ncbi:Protein RETICULATA-related 3, chloroplastic [Vitis vinifera]|uniref:Protein RETICULATA-related 3, chloroplastic n=1 Tax=Vitis vinifera TaxID=29760 RepID=A0A438D4L9_VITVI|nr:Protein RETICULATA-related 3, chloroplastic [Vitis vinifera]
MASRPNFGLNELDFVFSTLVVGSIMNFVLMYLLAPTASSVTPNLPAIFAGCPPGHMFESGSYGVLNRFGTFVYKGVLFATVGFAAGLVVPHFQWVDLNEEEDGPQLRNPEQASPTVDRITERGGGEGSSGRGRIGCREGEIGGGSESQFSCTGIGFETKRTS